MEVRLTVFVALVSLVLLWNTALLWTLFREMSRYARKANDLEGPSEKLLETLRTTVLQAESVSAKATGYSGKAREKVADLRGDLDRTENWVRFGLAKMDFEMDRISERVRDTADRAKQVAGEPLSRAGAIVHGLKAMLELVHLPVGDSAPRGDTQEPARQKGS